MAHIVPSLGVKVDAKGFQFHIDQYRRVMGMSVENVLKQQARLVCQDVLSLELPYVGKGGGDRGIRNDALNVGWRSVYNPDWSPGEGKPGDLQRIFAPLWQASWEDVARKGNFGLFSAWVSESKKEGRELPEFLKDSNTVGVGEWERFQSTYSKYESPYGKFAGRVDLSNYNAEEGQIKALHIKARGGTEVRNYKQKVQKYKKIHYISGFERKMLSYARRLKLRIGKLKGGFYETGAKLGRMKANSWIKDNSGGNGILETGNLKFDSEKSITVGNKNHGLMTVGYGYTRWKEVFSIRSLAMRASMANTLTKRGKSDYNTLTKLIESTKVSGLEVAGKDDPF